MAQKLRVTSVYNTPVVLNRGGRITTGGVIKFPGGRKPLPYNMEGLINKFTNKYICFYWLGGLETKDNYLRTTATQ